jgi:hypothetical protein
MRAAVTVMFLVALGVLGSCTSSADDGCYSDGDCAAGYVCDDFSGACRASIGGGNDFCSLPSDCPQSYTCGQERRCLPGDCYFNGCVTGFECQSSTGTWECLPGAAGAPGNDDSFHAGSGG